MTNRVVIGNLNGNFAARISKPGVNVLTATEIGDFLLHELYNTDRTIQRGQVVQSPGGADFSYVATPAVGYVPFCVATMMLFQTSAYNTSALNSAARCYFASTDYYCKDGQLAFYNWGKWNTSYLGVSFTSVWEYVVYAVRTV